MSIADQGHLNPLLALTEALVKAGWEVHFFVQESGRARIEAAGAVWQNYGEPGWDHFETATEVTVKRFHRDVDEEITPKKIMPFAVVPATLAVVPYLLEKVAQLSPRLIIHDAAAPWACVVADLLRLPRVCSMTALPMPMALRDIIGGLIFSKAGQETLEKAAEAIRADYGVEFNFNHCYTNYAPYTIVWSSRYWHKSNDEFDMKQFRYWGPLTSARAGFKDVAAASDGKPLVFVSLGTVVTGPNYEMFKPLVDHFYAMLCGAARALPDVSFLVAIGAAAPYSERSEDGTKARRLCNVEVPENMTIERSVDQLSVLQRAKAFLTHCGQNSSSEAVLFKVPVIACPFFGDQLDNAHRFVELGSGVLLSYAYSGEAVLAETAQCAIAWGSPRSWRSWRAWMTDACSRSCGLISMISRMVCMDARSISRITPESIVKSVRTVLDDPKYAEAIQAACEKQQKECGSPLADKLGDMFAHAELQASQLGPPAYEQ